MIHIPPRIESRKEFELLALAAGHDAITCYADVSHIAASLRRSHVGHAALADLQFWYRDLLDNVATFAPRAA